MLQHYLDMSKMYFLLSVYLTNNELVAIDVLSNFIDFTSLLNHLIHLILVYLNYFSCSSYHSWLV